MKNLSTYLIEEKQSKRKGGLYHKTQVNLAYNSNRIEGSRLTEEQTRYIFETRTIGFKDEEAVPVDDIIETSNHFVAFDYLLNTLDKPFLSEIIKAFHRILKTATFPRRQRQSWSLDYVPRMLAKRHYPVYYRQRPQAVLYSRLV